MDVSLKGHYAGFVSRLLAFFIDVAVLTVTFVAIGWFYSAITNLFPIEFYPGSNLQLIMIGVAAVLLMLGYFIFFWTLIGQTPGKMLLGLRIVSTDGSSVSFWQAVRRLFGYFISFFLYLGYIWILVDNHRQGWHDKIANTYVVYAWDARFGSTVDAQISKNEEPEAIGQE